MYKDDSCIVRSYASVTRLATAGRTCLQLLVVIHRNYLCLIFLVKKEMTIALVPGHFVCHEKR